MSFNALSGGDVTPLVQGTYHPPATSILTGMLHPNDFPCLRQVHSIRFPYCLAIVRRKEAPIFIQSRCCSST